jgi:uncharacterized protein
VPTVLLPGPIGESDQDWQHWLASQLTAAGREVRTASFPAAESAELAGWLSELRRVIAGLPDNGFDLLAHSAACILWLHHARQQAGIDDPAASSPRPSRVALVAPPAASQAMPGWTFLFPAPLNVDALRRAAEGTVLVGGDDDPYCPGGVAQVYGAPLKMAATVIAGAGSLTAASGFGPWPAVLDWCGRDNLAFRA